MDGWAGRLREVALFGVLVTAWGLNYLFVRAGLAFSGPLWLAAGRSAIGMVLVGAGVLAFARRSARLNARGRRDALLLGLPNTALFFGLWFAAAASVLPGEAAVVVYTFPLWVALLSWPVLGHRLGTLASGAVLLGFAGVVLIAEPWNATGTFPPLSAISELLGGAISWAVGTVFFQRRFRGLEVYEANFFQLLGGATALVAASWLLEPFPAGPPLPLLGVLLWLGGVGTAAAYTIWFSLLARLPAANLSSYVFLVPLVALAASTVILGERLDLLQAGGVAAVLVSVYVTGRTSARRGIDRPR